MLVERERSSGTGIMVFVMFAAFAEYRFLYHAGWSVVAAPTP